MGMKRQFGFFSILLAGLFFMGTQLAHAQYEDGSLVGTIRDSSGAVVSGASVSVTNTATGIIEKVTTSGDGNYEFPSLRTGVYTVAATATGFAQAVAQNITVSVGKPAAHRPDADGGPDARPRLK